MHERTPGSDRIERGTPVKKVLAAGLAAVILVGCTSGDTDDATTESPSDTAATSETQASPDTQAPPTSDEAPTTDAPGTDAPGTDDTTPPEDSVADEPEFVDQTLEGSTRGVTDDTIRIGITFPDLTSVDQLSVNHGDYEATFRALIDKINADGGINGRQIEPVIAPINLSGEGNADAVCVQLTEDEEVFVVVGFFLGEAALCYLEGHQQAIVGGSQTEDFLARAQAPWFTTDFGSDFEGDAVAELAESGALAGTVGVAATTGNQPLIEASILPALEAAGIEVVELAYNDAPPTDTAAAEAQNAAILQRFEAAGIDTILTASNDGVGIATALETSSYRPRLLMTNYNAMNSFINDETGRDTSVLEGSVGAGGYGPEQAIIDEPNMADCVQTIKDAGIEWVDPADWTEGPRPFISARIACWSLSLFQAIATRAGENLNYGTYEEAGNTIGPVQIPGYPDPFNYGPPPSADGDPPLYIWTWDPALGAYTIED